MERPLEGIGVVITRPIGTAAPLAQELASAGARTFVFPSLDIQELEKPAALGRALAKLSQSDWAIFVSANAVEKGLAALKARSIAWPKRTRVAAIGELTAEALRNSGFAEVISPQARFDTESLLERPELQAIHGSHILVFRGVGGREKLKESLEARGARVTYAECYRRAKPATDPAPLLAAWSRGEVQVVGVMSAETLENFVEMIGPEGRSRLSATALVVPHETVASHPDARRFGRVLVAPPGAAGLAATLGQLRKS